MASAPPAPERELTDRQRRFAVEYLVDLNGTQAAIRAGFSEKTAKQQASRLLSIVAIRRLIDEGSAKQEKRIELSADKVLQGLAKLAFFDIGEAYDPETNKLKNVRDMPREVRDALAGIDVHHDGAEEPGFTVKFKVAPRVDALEKLARHYKLLTDRVEHTLDKDFGELLKGARERARRR